MRRRIAAIATGAALLLGFSGALSPANSGVLCPPGCVAVGSIKVLGNGFPSPDQLSMSGTITWGVSTRTGGIANALDVNKNYYFYAYGAVSTGPSGFLNGTVNVYADSGYSDAAASSSGHDYVGGPMKIQGTRSSVRLHNSKLDIALVKVGTGFQGTVVSYG